MSSKMADGTGIRLYLKEHDTASLYYCRRFDCIFVSGGTESFKISDYNVVKNDISVSAYYEANSETDGLT